MTRSAGPPYPGRGHLCLKVDARPAHTRQTGDASWLPVQAHAPTDELGQRFDPSRLCGALTCRLSLREC